MSVAKDYKYVNAFSNELDVVEAVYDFSKDGGAVSVIDLMEMKEAMQIMNASVQVLAAVVSGGAATVEIGVKGGDTDAILPATLQAALPINTGFDCAAAGKGLYVASGGIISLEIKVAELTAGKIKVVLYGKKFA